MNFTYVWADSSTMIEVDKLLEGGLEKNRTQIEEKTEKEKSFLYNKYETTNILPAVLNIIPGFGMGSYLQGDVSGGIVGTCLGVLAWGSFLLPFYTPFHSDMVIFVFQVILGPIVGLAIGGVNSILGIILSLKYTKYLNNSLYDLLYENRKISFLVLPNNKWSIYNITNEIDSGMKFGFKYIF